MPILFKSVQRNCKFFASWKPHFIINCQLLLARSAFPWIDSYLPVPEISNIIGCQNASFLHLSLLLPAVFIMAKPEKSKVGDLTYSGTQKPTIRYREMFPKGMHIYITTQKSDCDIFLLNIFYILTFIVLTQALLTSSESRTGLPEFSLLLQAVFHTIKRSIACLNFKFACFFFFSYSYLYLYHLSSIYRNSFNLPSIAY